MKTIYIFSWLFIEGKWLNFFKLRTMSCSNIENKNNLKMKTKVSINIHLLFVWWKLSYQKKMFRIHSFLKFYQCIQIKFVEKMQKRKYPAKLSRVCLHFHCMQSSDIISIKCTFQTYIVCESWRSEYIIHVITFSL